MLSLLATLAAAAALATQAPAARNPTQTSIRNDAALIYLKLGRPADALRHFAVVTELEPTSAVAWYNEGVALEALHRTQDAADRYRRALELNPSYHAKSQSEICSSGRRVPSGSVAQARTSRAR